MNFFDHVAKRDSGCWEWTGYVHPGTGYGCGWFGLGMPRLPHRYSYVLAHGPISSGQCVCHSCDNRLCVNPDHLWLGTREENNHDRDAKGRAHHPVGEAHPRAKLTETDVHEIRALRGVMIVRVLAEKYGVSPSTIRDAQSGRNWRNCPSAELRKAA